MDLSEWVMSQSIIRFISMLKDNLDLLNKLSRFEWAKRIAPYEIHKWWSRRFSFTVRLIQLLYILSIENIPVRSKKDLIIDLVAPSEEIIKKAKEYTLLDPFFGSGTIIIEALSLGYRVVGIDINPVAWFIVKETIRLVDISKINRETKRIFDSLRPIIDEYYSTSCIDCNSISQVLHYFLVGKNNRTNKYLFRTHVIGVKDKFSWIYCPNCKKIIPLKRRIKPYSYKIQCPSCKSILETNKRTLPIESFSVYAVEYFCPRCKSRKYKVYFAENADVKGTLPSTLGDIIGYIPRNDIPAGKETNRLLKQQRNKIYELFTRNQLILLANLYKEIVEKSDKDIKESLLISFSDTLRASCLLAIYYPEYRKVTPAFSIASYWLPPQPVDQNPMGVPKSSKNILDYYGRGHFLSSVKRFIRAKKYLMGQDDQIRKIIYRLAKCLNIPFDKKELSNINSRNVLLKDHEISFSIDDINNANKRALLVCGPSQEILKKAPSNSIDIVFTDPPYGGFRRYSELAFFFFSWLKIYLQDKYKWFTWEYYNKLLNSEITLNGKSDLENFENKLAEVFKLIRNILKWEGIFLFTFRHHKTEVWKVVFRSLFSAQLNVYYILPILGESSGNLVSKKSYYELLVIAGVPNTRISICEKDLTKMLKVAQKSSGIPATSIDKKIMKKLPKMINSSL